MGIGTGVTKFAFAIHFPISTHLGLLFEGILLLELDSLLGSLEILLLPLSSGLTKFRMHMIMLMIHMISV